MKKLITALLCLVLTLTLFLPALAKDAPGFNAGLTVTQEGDSITVEVPVSNNTILATQKPTLTVPCPDGWENAAVSFGGQALESSFADHAVSFSVEQGGAYTIAKALKVFTVTFDTDGGSAVESQRIENGSTATRPAAPTKEGYLFSRWQLESADYDFTAAVTADISLKAVWTEDLNARFSLEKTATGKDLSAIFTAGKSSLTGEYIVMAASYAPDGRFLQSQMKTLTFDGNDKTCSFTFEDCAEASARVFLVSAKYAPVWASAIK